MGEIDQFVPLVNCWYSVAVPAVRFEPLNRGTASVSSLPAPDFVPFTSLPEGFLFELSFSEQDQIEDTAAYIPRSQDESIRSALNTLEQLWACEPCKVIEAFADYISQPECYGVGLRNRRQELVFSNAATLVPRYRQVCTETEAKDHVVHLETITLAKEQEARTANAVGQILISSRELWKRWKSKLLNSLSRYWRNGSTVGSAIFMNTAQASSY